MRVSFVVPVHNEARTIVAVLEAIDALGLDRQVVVVDDGSTDLTADLVRAHAARSEGVELHRKPHAGKGSALRMGFPLCDGDVVVIQDGDREYDPADVPDLLEPFTRDRADVVYGTRLAGDRPQRGHRFWHLLGNRFITRVAGILYGSALTDVETGYKLFTREVASSLRLSEDAFGVEAEITAQVCRRGLRVREVPISYSGRTYEEGKHVTWRDGFRAVYVLLRLRLEPLGGLVASAQDHREADHREHQAVAPLQPHRGLEPEPAAQRL